MGTVRRRLQLGGHFEPGDRRVLDAALLEAREESGIDGLIDPIPVRLDVHALSGGDDQCRVRESRLASGRRIAKAHRWIGPLCSLRCLRAELRARADSNGIA